MSHSSPNMRQPIALLGFMITLLSVVHPVAVLAQGTPNLILELSPIGYEHRFKTDIDNGGEIEQRRAFGGAQLRLQPSDRWEIGLNTSYTYHQFRFSGSTGFGQLDPWEHIHLLTFSAPMTFEASTHW